MGPWTLTYPFKYPGEWQMDPLDIVLRIMLKWFKWIIKN